eukprot:gnl/TRDRNA2_/TRDRNA2_115848_c0_seq1.p1 gnl/TRDRNA2_/TRDRNA2_115848_c0~~gnl/TRDRNA2_/TRDRNA2_115848_c0_seq1.p1  ORF type:complete len:176 (-),score=51.00 gnl/TRDRNA2_/TRDRNA2_115848_c0_seq1:50-577(-)
MGRTPKQTVSTDPENHKDNIYGKNSEADRVTKFLKWLKEYKATGKTFLFETGSDEDLPTESDTQCIEYIMGGDPSDLVGVNGTDDPSKKCAKVLKKLQARSESGEELTAEDESIAPAVESEIAAGVDGPDDAEVEQAFGGDLEDDYRKELEDRDGRDHSSDVAPQADGNETEGEA